MMPTRGETITLRWQGLASTALATGQGPVVLCLHGFPDHAFSFRHQLAPLAAAGFRVISPNLRGYEPSSQPGSAERNYHPMRVASDVIEWAEQLGPLHLVGHDWGALVTFLATAVAPERFRSATVMAVPSFRAVEEGIGHHLGQLRNSWYMFFFQLRGLADWVVRSRDFAFIEKLWRDWSPGWNWEPEEMQRLKETFRRPGVLRAALSYYRATFNPFLVDSRRMRSLARQRIDVPTLAITGATDGCMDTRLFDYMDPAMFSRGLRIERIQAAGHFVHQEAPERVNQLLVQWIHAFEGGGTST
jgi:pimeloyl-ACP methyl ester carboxylesterase